ncbi:MAG: N-sulfoglucosamine sulfohydrolase [Verrucomicrobiota bacterium]|nr:N-sulfoglucosamine sulfohydrolase [Verrucomicrobiota bacterium]
MKLPDSIRPFGLSALVGLFAAGLVGPTVCARPPARPNILVFICDDLSARDLPAYGATDVRAPHTDRLAASGMVFERAFIVSPACAPSRAAMLTGLYPTRNGATANHSYKRDDVASLPAVLAGLGYQTAAFGKVAHGPKDTGRHGFVNATNNNKFDPAEIAAWLQQRDRSRPVALFAGTHAPHVPWPANHGYDPATLRIPRFHYDTPETRADRARYYTDVTQGDTDFGAVVEMARRELGPDTLVIFTSDHGAQWPFGKWNLYDEGICVPLIIAWPGHIPAGTRTAANISWLDLLPTLIDVAGGDVPAGLDGRSFAPVLTTPGTPHRDRIFTTHDHDGRANVYPIRSVRTAGWKYIRNLQPGWIHSNHSDRFRKDGTARYFESWEAAAVHDPHAAFVLTRYRQRPAEELYDLAADPDELNNLAADSRHAATLVALRGELDVWMESQSDAGVAAIKAQPWLPGDPGLVGPDLR